MAHELGVEVDLLEEEVERSEHRVVDREKADPKRDEAVCGTLVSDTLLHIRIEFRRQDTVTDPRSILPWPFSPASVHLPELPLHARNDKNTIRQATLYC